MEDTLRKDDLDERAHFIPKKDKDMVNHKTTSERRFLKLFPYTVSFNDEFYYSYNTTF